MAFRQAGRQASRRAGAVQAGRQAGRQEGRGGGQAEPKTLGLAAAQLRAGAAPDLTAWRTPRNLALSLRHSKIFSFASGATELLGCRSRAASACTAPLLPTAAAPCGDAAAMCVTNVAADWATSAARGEMHWNQYGLMCCSTHAPLPEAVCRLGSGSRNATGGHSPAQCPPRSVPGRAKHSDAAHLPVLP